MRKAFVKLHRYVGLVLAPFLIIIGLTGSVIIFFEDLDAWANPGLRFVTSQGEHLDPLTIRAQLEREEPQAHFYAIRFPEFANEAMYFYTEGAIDPATGEESDLGHDQVYADPYTGQRLGDRLWGHFSLEPKDWFTFLYFLHYSLILPEYSGEIFMGCVALLWLLDCFVGMYLTFPPPQRNGKPFWRRWMPSFRIKTGAGSGRLVYDAHRANGLWVWGALLVFAWSGFSFNMPRVHQAIVGKITRIEDTNALPILDEPLLYPKVGWSQALDLGKAYMTEQASSHGFVINRASMLIYRRESGAYVYRVNSSRDIRTRHDYGFTGVVIDATTGSLLRVEIPSGDTAGNTFTTWLKSLHTAVVFGWPLKILNCLIGLSVVALSVTGILVWMRKRSSRVDPST